MKQLELFTWADNKPSNVIDAIPALCKKAALETIYRIPRPVGGGKLIPFGSKAA